jgi:hypothetical protein
LHNSKIYGVDKNVQLINKDFLSLNVEDIKYPADRAARLDVVFMSPPWGGVGYNLLEEYKLEYLYPEFGKCVSKALEFSRNLVFFLPKNTSVEQIIESLLRYAPQFVDDPETKKNQLVIEIEQIVYGTSCKGIHIYTGDVADVDPREVVEYFYERYCQPFTTERDENYLKQILGNIFQLCGYCDFIPYFKRDPSHLSKISLQKVIKKMQ